MQCEKCGSSAMEARRLFRSSGCLVIAGILLLVGSVSAMVLAGLLGLTGPRATREKAASLDKAALVKAVSELERIPGVQPELARELEVNGKLSSDTLSRLTTDQRQRVLSVTLEYHGQRASTGVAHGVTAGIGTFMILVLLVFGIPGSIVGLLLVRRRKVWRCSSCGFAFDRT